MKIGFHSLHYKDFEIYTVFQTEDLKDMHVY